MTSDGFYSDLPGTAEFLKFSDPASYVSLPDDWYVVITDVVDSTVAIQDGKYRDVNAIGVASIVNVLNATKPVRIPFVFGGDGATLCVPDSVLDKVKGALLGTQAMAHDSFGITVRTGLVSMRTIRDKGHVVQVGKFQPRDNFTQAMFSGNGILYAEMVVKGNIETELVQFDESTTEPTMQFAGFECRWNEVPSPHGENVALLIVSLAGDRIYVEVMETISQIYGDEQDHHPLRPELLSLAADVKTLSTQTRLQSSTGPRWKRWTTGGKLIATSLLGRALMSNKVRTDKSDWGSYKEALIANTVFKKFDGALRMLISGTEFQRLKLTEALDQLNSDKKIAYGIHSDPGALITCMISDYKNDHFHFVDGSNGGYALAAEGLKQQLRELNN